MSNPYESPHHWSETEARVWRAPLVVKIAAVAAVLAFALACGSLLWSTIELRGVQRDWIDAATAALFYIAPCALLNLATHGQSWARQCFVLVQGALMLWHLLWSLVKLDVGDLVGASMPLAIGLLLATSVFCMQHDSTKAWLANLKLRADSGS